MRKVVSLAVIFIAMFQCFAADTLPYEKNYNVVLEYNPVVMEVGFINAELESFDSIISDDMVVNGIELSVDSQSNTGKGPDPDDKPCYVYWKIYSANNLSVSISADDLGSSGVDPIPYTITFDNNLNDTLSSSGDGKKTIEYSGGTRDFFGSLKIDIETVDLADKATADYTGNIKIEIDGGNAS